MRLTIHTFLTLDGVLQAPGGPDEDRDGDFPYGGWSFPYGDQDFGVALSGWVEHARAVLLRRKTHHIFACHWPPGPQDIPDLRWSLAARHRPRRPDRRQAQRAAEVRRLEHADVGGLAQLLRA